MKAKPQQPKEREGAISVLNATIETLNLAKEVSSITPAKAVFGSVSVILTMIKETMINQLDYFELGLACAEVCTALDRGLNGKRLNELNNSVWEAIAQLTTAVAEIQRKIIKQGKRNIVSQHFHAKNDKEKIAGWRSDLARILQVFNTELAINTNVTVSEIHHGVVDTRTMVSDIHRTIVKGQEGSDGKDLSTRTSTLGESPPRAPRACFGRDELIEKIVGLAENLIPTALIGAGGIGKTSIALTVLHHDRIKRRFGDNRRFIRCDQFIPSYGNFLGRLSKAIGAGVENPEDLASLRPFLSSKEVLIVLDNAESIFDPRGTDSKDICTAVEELSHFSNVSLCITSRISTIPSDCEVLTIPTLSTEAARDAFYRIYRSNERSDLISSVLEQLDFHPLSITLIATVAHQNKWSADRIMREWEVRRTSVLHTEHDKSLATTIELSLASPLFQDLGPDARALLEVVAFFPQGVDENNIDWLFPTISNRANVFDKFCVLSLAHRTHGFVTMLAPLRDYLRPNDPKSSSLLCATKEQYFTRMSVDIDPDGPSFGETRWITSEDVNVEHLLDVFTTIDADSDGVWDACANFMNHLRWHKSRLVILKPKIEGLPYDHRFKPKCLFRLSWLFEAVGNWEEYKRLLTHVLELQRERGDDRGVAWALRDLSDSNWKMHLTEEGIQQAKEALEIFERLGDTMEQARCLIELAQLLCEDKQFNAAEEAASHAANIFSEKGNQFMLCQSHHVLGDIYRTKGKTQKAIHHFEMVLGIASPSNWDHHLFWAHYYLARLFRDQGGFDDANAHIESAKSHAVNNAYHLGVAMKMQASIWYRQHRLEEARSEALRAADVYESLGAAKNIEGCRKFLRNIEKKLDTPVAFSSSRWAKRWHRWSR